jgi:hypothetical protein
MLGIGKRGQIASLITSDLLRKDATKRRGQDIDILRERMGIAGAQTREETQQTGAMSREELAQKSATYRTKLAEAGDMARQKLIAQSSYKQATDVANIRGSFGPKQQKLANEGAVSVVGEREKWDSKLAEEEATRQEAILAKIPTMSDEPYEYNPAGVDYDKPSGQLAAPLTEEEKRKKKKSIVDEPYNEILLLP